MEIGSIVKVNPEIFKGEAKLTETYGKLGYSGILSHLTGKIISFYDDDPKGRMAQIELINLEATLKKLFPEAKEIKFGGMPYILVADLVRASSKLTLDYIIQEPSVSEKEKALLKIRKQMKKEGLAVGNPKMKANWAEIQKARKEKSEVEVLLPKQKIILSVKKSELPKDGDEESIKSFKASLVSSLGAMRRERKAIKKEEKEVFGRKVEKVGGVFTKVGSLRDAYVEYMDNILDEDKAPKLGAKDNYIGIEIEMILNSDEEFFRKALIKNNLHRFVTIKEDGSLRVCHGNGGYHTMELTVICKNTELTSVMQRLGKILDHPKVDAYANRSCGLHVHLDMRNRNPSLVYKNLVRCQDIFRGAQPVGRIQSTYCQRNKTDSFNFKGEPSREDRYVVVNPHSYSKHKTIEIRIHEGTTDSENIIKWASFLDAIASHDRELVVENPLTHAEQLVSLGVSLSEESVQYVDRRINKFNSLKTDLPVA